MNDDEMGLNNFHKNGFAVIRNFYDYDAEILPILQGVSNIVRYVAETNKIYFENDGWPSDLTTNIMTLSQLNRHFASNVYDAVKQIPQFLSLVSNKRLSRALISFLRRSCRSLVNFAIFITPF